MNNDDVLMDTIHKIISMISTISIKVANIKLAPWVVTTTNEITKKDFVG